jgi:hypothetical protein
MLWLQYLVTGFSLQKPRFNDRPFNVGFVVDKQALGQAYLQVRQFSPVSNISLVRHAHSLVCTNLIVYNPSSFQHC